MFPPRRFDPDDFIHRTVLTPDMVMRRWFARVEHDAPWEAMARDDRGGYVGLVVREMLDPADTFEVRGRRCRLERAARQHGAFRRRQRCEATIIRRDFVVLRQALRDALRQAGAGPSTIRLATRCLVPDWRVARYAAHEGYVNG
jgi:hypothetical protein